MRIFFYRWNSLAESDAVECMQKMGMHLLFGYCEIKDYNNDETVREEVREVYKTEGFDYIFSFN